MDVVGDAAVVGAFQYSCRSAAGDGEAVGSAAAADSAAVAGLAALAEAAVSAAAALADLGEHGSNDTR